MEGLVASGTAEPFYDVGKIDGNTVRIKTSTVQYGKNTRKKTRHSNGAGITNISAVFHLGAISAVKPIDFFFPIRLPHPPLVSAIHKRDLGLSYSRYNNRLHRCFILNREH